MRILVATTSLSRNAGGLFQSVRLSGIALANLDIDVSVIGVADEYTASDLECWHPLAPMACEPFGPRVFGWSPAVPGAIRSAQPDLIHLHGIWQYISMATGRYASQKGIPYLISPRGMLEPWALSNSRRLKKLAASLYADRNLRQAACIHALSGYEAESIRGYGLRNPVAVIPNGVELPPELPEDSNNGPIFPADRNGSARKNMLFLGRIHPKKGLATAIMAWARHKKDRNAKEWRLVIAGWDQAGHEQELQKLCTQLGLEWSRHDAVKAGSSDVIFTGPVFSGDKDRLFRAADAFILPSLSEGLPVAVLEAWSYALPVIMTGECHIPEGFTAGAAIRAEAGIADSLYLAIGEIMKMPEADLVNMGASGLALVKTSFTWPKVAADMKAVYEWTLGISDRPPCLLP